jgi:hypothetical protein
MSEIKIQTTAADELAGGQTPLTTDDRRRGGDFNQNTLSICRGENVTPGTAGPIAPAPNNREAATVGGMAVAAPLAVSVKPVDRRTIEGSTPGDFRARAADAVLPNQPGPRDAKGQAQLNGKLRSLDGN